MSVFVALDIRADRFTYDGSQAPEDRAELTYWGRVYRDQRLRQSCICKESAQSCARVGERQISAWDAVLKASSASRAKAAQAKAVERWV